MFSSINVKACKRCSTERFRFCDLSVVNFMIRMFQKRDCEITNEKNQDDRESVLYLNSNEMQKNASENLSCHSSYSTLKSYFRTEKKKFFSHTALILSLSTH
jgi:hypothetical protein